MVRLSAVVELKIVPPLLKMVGVTAERPADNNLCVFQEADWRDIREPDHSWFGLRA